MAENNLELIVRLHPKESKDFSYKIYEDIFEKKIQFKLVFFKFASILIEKF